MDALPLLRDVSEAYRSLRTLAIDATVVSESGDENENNRSERRVRLLYAAPNRLRSEPLGRHGALQVVDGEHVHVLFGGGMPGGPRYSKHPAGAGGALPHQFRPDFPGSAETFLFQGIHERVAHADYLREEDGCHVLSVEYEPPSHPAAPSFSAIEYWIDSKTRLVMRQTYDVSHRRPGHDETHWSRNTLFTRSIRLNEPIPDDAFHFTPPPDAIEMGQQGCIVGGGTSGVIQRGGDERTRLESSTSHHWEGETLVEHATWKIRGTKFKLERRFTFTQDGKEARIEERVTGPHGDREATIILPLD